MPLAHLPYAFLLWRVGGGISATIEPRYCIVCPLGNFAVIHLRRPPLSNGEQQHLLSITIKEYDKVMEAEHADP